MLHEISDLVTECLELFQLSLQQNSESPRPDVNSLESKDLENLSQEQSRFSRWSATAGVFKQGSDSLDYRLRDASHIRLHINNLVRRVRQLLQDLLAIKNGDTTPWDQLSGEDSSCDETLQEPPRNELAQIVLHVIRLIDDLFDLKIATQNPAPHDVLIRGQFMEMPNSWLKESFNLLVECPKIEQALAARLGKAISSRRRYFEYREALGSDYETIPGNLSIEYKAAVSSSEPEKTSDNLGMKEEVNATSGGTEAADTDSDTSDTTTIIGRVELPPFPKPARGGNAFTCPYCRVGIRISSLAE
ncbi:hypothetical protein FSARC_5646 [Fusarium sarcochroum]|uniref:Uncharacterized protein n=1 Tax=Fusarium sarcochroum TaxID=1208366 RepID=A0A8H4TZ43_9HYPO|nr:hypothetical protein FSARC_5646 [Fusarium sarcochroum]